MEIIINKDVSIRICGTFSKNIPYKAIPEIIYKEYQFTQLLNVNFFEEHFNRKKTEYLRIYYCSCENFQLCKFRASCFKNISLRKICPYSNKIDLNIQRKNSKNYNNEEEFIKIARFFTNEKLYEYATWIIQNKNTTITKELFEEIRTIPGLDPKYFSECYNRYGRIKTLVENEQLIYNQEPFYLYKLDTNMPNFIYSYLQMANDYLNDLNDLISGITFNAVSEELVKLRMKYKNQRIFIPIFDYIIINIPDSGNLFYRDILLLKSCNNPIKNKDILIKNTIVSIKKTCFDDVMLLIRSLRNDIYSLLIERYEQGEHKQSITEDEINKFI